MGSGRSLPTSVWFMPQLPQLRMGTGKGCPCFPNGHYYRCRIFLVFDVECFFFNVRGNPRWKYMKYIVSWTDDTGGVSFNLMRFFADNVAFYQTNWDACWIWPWQLRVMFCLWSKCVWGRGKNLFLDLHKRGLHWEFIHWKSAFFTKRHPSKSAPSSHQSLFLVIHGVNFCVLQELQNQKCRNSNWSNYKWGLGPEGAARWEVGYMWCMLVKSILREWFYEPV